MPSSAGLDKPVGEKVWFSAAEIPRPAGGAAGGDCPKAGGEGLPAPLRMAGGLLDVVLPAALPIAGGVPGVPPVATFPLGVIALGAVPPAAGPRAAGMTPKTLADPMLLAAGP